MKYKEQLKDRRWKKKSLEILHRDNYHCLLCGMPIEGSILNVHHLSYESGKKAWEYPDDNLVTLCADCHKYVHDNNIQMYLRHGSGDLELCKKETYHGDVHEGSVLYIEDIDAVAVCANEPVCVAHDGFFFFEVKTSVSLRNISTESKFELNEYSLPITGMMAVEYRHTTEEEKEMLADAVRNEGYNPYDYGL